MIDEAPESVVLYRFASDPAVVAVVGYGVIGTEVTCRKWAARWFPSAVVEWVEP